MTELMSQILVWGAKEGINLAIDGGQKIGLKFFFAQAIVNAGQGLVGDDEIGDLRWL